VKSLPKRYEEEIATVPTIDLAKYQSLPDLSEPQRRSLLDNGYCSLASLHGNNSNSNNSNGNDATNSNSNSNNSNSNRQTPSVASPFLIPDANNPGHFMATMDANPFNANALMNPLAMGMPGMPPNGSNGGSSASNNGSSATPNKKKGKNDRLGVYAGFWIWIWIWLWI
jgi:hypothetical protein